MPPEANVPLPQPDQPSSPVEAPPAPLWADRRVRGALLVVVLLAVAAGAAALRGERPSDEELAERAVVERTAWRNYLRQAPMALEGGLAEGRLAATDGAGPEGRYEDYYAFEAADSSAFSVIVTSADFAPDLVVTTPDGRRLAGSTLWQTDRRAEVSGLRGPGRFVVTVTAREPGAGGTYELSAGPPPRPRPVEPGDAVDSTLGRGGGLRAGRYEDHYAVLAPPGRPVLVEVAARSFRPRLHLLGPEGEVVEPWGSVALVESDTLNRAVFRYRPGWDAPYLLLVSSAEGGARGDYALRVARIDVPTVRTDGAGVRGTLGEGGWYRGGRYVDTYRFEAPAGTSVLVEVRSEAFKPEVALKEGDRTLATRSGSGVVRLERELDGGRYEVDVTSVDAGATGDYVLVVTVDAPEGPRTQTFSTEARRTGTTVRGHTFEVTVRRVSVTPEGDDRVRVVLQVEERSLDFRGEWDEWDRRVARTRLADDTGRTYRPVDRSGGQESDGVEPGEARRGEIVYEGPRHGDRPETMTLLYPIGVEGRVVVAVPVELER